MTDKTKPWKYGGGGLRIKCKSFHEFTFDDLGKFTVVFTQNTDEQGNVICESQEFREMMLPDNIKRWQAAKVRACLNEVGISHDITCNRAPAGSKCQSCRDRVRDFGLKEEDLII